MMAILRILSMEEWLSGERSEEVSQRPKRSQTSADRMELLGNCFQSAPLSGRVDPFAMLADQILQPLHRFHFGNVEFHRRFADVKIHLRQRGPCHFGPTQKTPDAYPLMTTGQLEGADSCLPTCCAGILPSQCVVLVDVPERAVVGRIDCYICVIAPARVGGPLYP
jgi:hypothetical protein